VEKGLRRATRRAPLPRLWHRGVALGLGFVAFLFSSIISTGWTVFQQSYLKLEIDYAQDVLDPDRSRDPEVIGAADFNALIKAAMRQQFPDVEAAASCGPCTSWRARRPVRPAPAGARRSGTVGQARSPVGARGRPRSTCC